MSDAREQYDEMWKAIRSNIAAIRSLLDQADNLSNIVTTLEDPQAKGRLSKSVQDLYKNINSLITHTDYLFEQFKKFASTVEPTRDR